MVKSEIQNIKLRFGIIGNAEGLNRAIDIAIQVAPTDLSVLVTGESGVGKESFPQIIHQFSRRKHGQLHGPSGSVINIERLHCSRIPLDR